MGVQVRLGNWETVMLQSRKSIMFRVSLRLDLSFGWSNATSNAGNSQGGGN